MHGRRTPDEATMYGNPSTNRQDCMHAALGLMMLADGLSVLRLQWRHTETTYVNRSDRPTRRRIYYEWKVLEEDYIPGEGRAACGEGSGNEQ